MTSTLPPYPVYFANEKLFRQSDAMVNLHDRGLAYGDGVFETMLAYKGRLPFWEYHHKRLLKGLAFLGIALDKALFESHCEKLFDYLNHNPQTCVVKLMVTRGESTRGYVPTNSSANIFTSISSLPLGTAQNEVGCSVHLCKEVLAEPISWAGLKTLNQLSYVLASKERVGTDFDEGLVCSSQGNIIEATARNIFCVKDGQLLTPDLSAVGVAGVMRGVIIERIAPELNLAHKICSISPNELLNADEIFLCNSVAGIWPVTKISGITADVHQRAVGVITRKIQTQAQGLIEAK